MEDGSVTGMADCRTYRRANAEGSRQPLLLLGETNTLSPLLIAIVSVLTGVSAATSAAEWTGAAIVVAARDASPHSKLSAQFTCDGSGDQEEINAAIRALPPCGGKVLLTEGTYDIRKVPGTLGGVLIGRSHVVLEGQGTSTRLIQAPDQDTNVIRIIGSGVGHIAIRNLWVDANRDRNNKGTGDPAVSHDRFEFCGIKGFCGKPGESATPLRDITIERCHVHDAHRLGIMLEGQNMRVLNCVLGNAGSDAVEILTGPGEIRGNYVEITGRTHVAIGSDRANSMIMSDNIVHICPTGDLDIGFRSWADSRRHVISNNVLTVDAGGKCGAAMEVRGWCAVVSGNAIHSANSGQRLPLKITGPDTIVASNVFENVTVLIDDQTGSNRPILVHGNILENSAIEQRRGNVIQSPSR